MTSPGSRAMLSLGSPWTNRPSMEMRMDVLSPAASWRMTMISSPASSGQAAGLGHDATGPSAGRGARTARASHRPDDGDAAAEVFEDVDGDLGLEDDLLPGELGQLLLHLELGQVADLDLAQERQGDPALLGDADDELADLRHAEDRDLEEVLGPDLVFGARILPWAAGLEPAPRTRDWKTAPRTAAASAKPRSEGAAMVFFMVGSFGRKAKIRRSGTLRRSSSGRRSPGHWTSVL